MRCGWLYCLGSWVEVCPLSADICIHTAPLKHFPSVHLSCVVLWVGLHRHRTKASIWSKSTSIKTSWSLPLRCRQRLEASHAVQRRSALLWFTQNIIASDCLCVYWIRPALLMHKEINKQAMWSVAGMLRWPCQPLEMGCSLHTARLWVLLVMSTLYADQSHKIIRAIRRSRRGINSDVLSIG